MCKHHIGSPIQRFIVGPFKSFTFHRGMEENIDFLKEMFDVVIGDVAAVILEELIDPNQQIGDGMKPCEPGIALQQFQQAVHGLNRSVDAFVSLLFGNDERAVKPDEALADRKDRAPAGIDWNERGGLRGSSHTFKCSRLTTISQERIMQMIFRCKARYSRPSRER